MDENAKIEAKKTMLKTLANKMYELESSDWKKGKGPKPAPEKAEMKQSVAEKKEVKKETPKVDSAIREMVKGFFASKDDKPAIASSNYGYVKRKPVRAGQTDKIEPQKPKKRHRGRPRKKVII